MGAPITDTRVKHERNTNTTDLDVDIDIDIDTDTEDLNTSSTNVERAIAGAASGTVAAILCFPLDTVRPAPHHSRPSTVDFG